MHCEGCLRTVMEAARRVPGVVRVKGSLDDKMVSVEHRDAPSVKEKIRDSIREAGFPVG
jgi:copper chaperone CopZ